ncbi:flagellar hook-length control protein FliK [Clostridium malenominatum]|uniref:Flagellar hook-length control protein FliK n=1 Tax=Clostridium malenominatum TaxID=1539 RepID=A0ABP3U9Y4_9CLOT
MIDNLNMIVNKLAAKTQTSSPSKAPKEEKKDFNEVLNNFTETKKVSKEVNAKNGETEKNPLENLDLENINVEELDFKDTLMLLQFFFNQNNANIPHEEIALNSKDLFTSKEEVVKLDSILHRILNGEVLPEKEALKDSNPIIEKLIKKVEEEIETMVPIDSKEDVEVSKIFNSLVKGLKDEKNTNEDQNSKTAIFKEDMGINTMQKLKINKSFNENYFSKEQDNPEIKEEKILFKFVKDKEEDTVFKPINLMASPTNKLEVSTENIKVEELVIKKETMVDDIVKTVKFMDNGSLKNLTVKINPKELGEMVISIVMEDGKIKANVTASNKEAYNLINANLNEINNKLENSQIKIQNFTLNLYEDATFFKGENNQDKPREDRKEHKSRSIASIGEISEMDQENNSEDLRNVNILA